MLPAVQVSPLLISPRFAKGDNNKALETTFKLTFPMTGYPPGYSASSTQELLEFVVSPNADSIFTSMTVNKLEKTLALSLSSLYDNVAFDELVFNIDRSNPIDYGKIISPGNKITLTPQLLKKLQTDIVKVKAPGALREIVGLVG